MTPRNASIALNAHAQATPCRELATYVDVVRETCISNHRSSGAARSGSGQKETARSLGVRKIILKGDGERSPKTSSGGERKRDSKWVNKERSERGGDGDSERQERLRRETQRSKTEGERWEGGRLRGEREQRESPCLPAWLGGCGPRAPAPQGPEALCFQRGQPGCPARANEAV